MSTTTEHPPLTQKQIDRAYTELCRIGANPIRPSDAQTDARLNRWYGKGIYESMISRPTPRHIQSTVHHLNHWLRWLNFGIVY